MHETFAGYDDKHCALLAESEVTLFTVPFEVIVNVLDYPELLCLLRCFVNSLPFSEVFRIPRALFLLERTNNFFQSIYLLPPQFQQKTQNHSVSGERVIEIQRVDRTKQTGYSSG